tara:strand:- start:350 stop:523 length:174 start_codon:yes stop_codon:yes gene_type:complete
MNLISGICFIAAGALCLIASIIGMTAESMDAFKTAYVMQMIGFAAITAGGVFHMLKK